MGTGKGAYAARCAQSEVALHTIFAEGELGHVGIHQQSVGAFVMPIGRDDPFSADRRS